MMDFSQAVRAKADWIAKLPKHADTWAREAGQQGLSAEACAYVLAELEWYARGAGRRQLPGGAWLEPAAVDGTWQADELVPRDLRAALLEGARTLERAAGEEDWHPGSDGRVLDLVHPSLYCLSYGVSPVLLTTTTTRAWALGMLRDSAPMPPPKADVFRSAKHAWLPSVFEVDPAGGVKVGSYINNLHPRNRELYAALARIFERMLPLYENVLGASLGPRRHRVEVGDWYPATPSVGEFLQGLGADLRDDHDSDDDPSHMPVDESDYYDEWLDRRVPVQPVPPAFEAPSPVVPYALRGNLRVIVKLANIELTPESPRYDGSSWHVEGMLNEQIVATGIYYYSVENVSVPDLQFREAVDDPSYEQNDDKGVEAIYGLSDEGPLVQEIGRVATSEGRCLAFPNRFQHRVGPCELLDPTRPGRRRILVFFLVDPTARVVTTANVPPQRMSWLLWVLRRSEPFVRLPIEVLDHIGRYVDGPAYPAARGPPMSLVAACARRKELMEERATVADAVTSELYERPFSLCEH